jgi:hypothetical protein
MTKDVPDGFSVAGVSQLVDADGNIKLQWIKSKQEQEETLSKLEEALKERFERVKPLAKVATPKKALQKDLMIAHILSDAHIGMFAWGEENDGSDWDLKIAEKMIVGAVKYLVDAAPDCEECAIINLGDYFHSDNMENRTVKGRHALDVDTRWQKVIAVGIDALISCIDFALAKHKRVRVVNKPGNHDPHAGIMLNIALMKAYRNNPRVIFDDSPSYYSYFRFGKNLIGITHGDKRVKPAELPLIMANDRPEDWGASKQRYWYTGHVHHQRKFEPTGSNCLVESFRIMASRDAWHQGEGYRAGREMQSILLHSEYGETGRTIVTPDMLR